jgi:hypothetical protein
MAKRIVSTRHRTEVEEKIREELDKKHGPARGFGNRSCRDRQVREDAKKVLSKQREVVLPNTYDIVVVQLGSDENPATQADKIATKGLKDGVIVVRHDLSVEIKRTMINKKKHLVVKVGTDDHPASVDDLERVRNAFSVTPLEPSLTIVTHHALDIESADPEKEPR